MNPVKTLPLFLLLIGSARVQGDGFVGKPCTINENMKGTCFYKADGVISYWIIRMWLPSDLGGGPERTLDEVVGYPAFLKQQQDYNRWLKSVPPTPGLHIDVPILPTPDQLELESKQIEKESREITTSGAPTWETIINRRHFGQSDHGWQTGYPPPVKYILVPGSMRETGEFNLDTLRIPMFIGAGRILAAQERLKADCSSASDVYHEWNGLQPSPNYRNQEKDICFFSDLPTGTAFADWQANLNARWHALAPAETASRQFGDLVHKARNVIPSDGTAFTPDRLPVGMVDQLLSLQTAWAEALRHSESLESDSTALSSKYRATTAQLAKAKQKALCEDQDKAMVAEFGKQWLAEFGRDWRCKY
jgi:hypothetical protein